MIFEQLFGITFLTTFIFFLFIGQKQWREKKEERVRIECEYERQSYLKIVTKWLYKYHFSNLWMSR